MIKAWYFSFLAGGLLITRQAQAALGGLEITSDKIGLNKESLWVLIPRLLNWIFGFLGIIFLVLIMVGGIIWMTASGNEAQTKKAGSLMTAAVIGLVIVGAAFAITAFLGDTFGPK